MEPGSLFMGDWLSASADESRGTYVVIGPAVQLFGASGVIPARQEAGIDPPKPPKTLKSNDHVIDERQEAGIALLRRLSRQPAARPRDV
jgi:hypothetical protein